MIKKEKEVFKMIELQGTEKQVKWADDIRDQFKDQFDFFEEHYLDEKYNAGKDYQAQTGKYPSRRRGDFPKFLRKPEIQAKVKASQELGTKQDVSKEWTKILARKGYKLDEYTALKERFDFDSGKEYHDYLIAGAKNAFDESSASWWIDNQPR